MRDGDCWDEGVPLIRRGAGTAGEAAGVGIDWRTLKPSDLAGECCCGGRREGADTVGGDNSPF
eukprot:168314-Rhodomonas_salina.2